MHCTSLTYRLSSLHLPPLFGRNSVPSLSSSSSYALERNSFNHAQQLRDIAASGSSLVVVFSHAGDAAAGDRAVSYSYTFSSMALACLDKYCVTYSSSPPVVSLSSLQGVTSFTHARQCCNPSEATI